MQQSMSRTGNCWDNAPVESFFKTLKVERLYQVSSRMAA
jgi:transposase InsO family protein